MPEEGGQPPRQPPARLSNPPQPMAFFLDAQPLCSVTQSTSSVPIQCSGGGNRKIIAPLVQSSISNKGQITGLSVTDADTLAKQLRSGSFPVPLNVVQEDDVDATLGDTAVIHSVPACLIAILVAMI